MVSPHESIQPESQHLQDTLAHLEQELSRAEDGLTRAHLLSSIGRLYEEALRKPDQALFHYKRALDYHPREENALDGIARVLVLQGRHRELEEVLKQSIAISSDRMRTAHLEFQLAILYLEQLQRNDLAIQSLVHVLDLDPLHRAAYPLLDRLYRQQSDWTAALANASSWLELTQDKTTALEIMNGMAGIWLDHLQDRTKAREVSQEILLLDPENAQALMNLEKLSRLEEKWEELTAILERESSLLAFRHPQEQVRIALELSELYADKLADPDHAEINLRKVLGLDSSNRRARELIARIHEARSNWIELIQVYRADLTLVTDAIARAERLLRIAEITEKHLGRGAEATAILEEASHLLQEVPGGLVEDPQLRQEVSEQLIHRYRAEGRREELKNFYLQIYTQARSVSEKIESLTQLTELAEPLQAERFCLDLLDLSNTLPLPSQREAKLSAYKKLANFYLGWERWESLLEVYSRQIALLEQSEDRAMLYFRMGEIQNRKLNQLPLAVDSYRNALELNRGLIPALRARREILMKLGNHQEVLELFQTEISLTSGAKARSAIFFQAGCFREDELKQGELAVRDFEQALELDPQNDRALRRLAVHYYQTEQWEKAAPMFDQLAEWMQRAEDQDALKKASFWTRRARIAEKLEQLETAADYLNQALEESPNFVPAVEQMAEIHFRSHRWAEAKRYYREFLRLVQVTDARKNLPQMSQVLLHLAHVEERLGNRAESILEYKKVLEFHPGHLGALEALVNLESQAQDWLSVQKYYDLILRNQKDQDDWVTIQFAKADIWENRLQKPKNAIACYRAVLEKDPLNSLALERLAQIYCAMGELDEGVEILQRLIRGETEAARLIPYLYSLGRIYRFGLKEAKAAEEQYRQILSLDPENLAALKELIEIFLAEESFENLADVYQKVIAVVKKTDPLMAIPFYLKLGDLYRNRLQQLPQSIAAYKGVIDLDADNVGARNALVELYASNESFHEEAIRQHRKLLQADPLRMSSYRAIAQIYYQRKEFDRAFCLYRILESLGEAQNQEKDFIVKCHAVLHMGLRSEIPESLRQEVMLHPAERTLLYEIFKFMRDPLRELFWDENLLEKTEQPLGPFARQMQECIDQVSPVLQITTPQLKIYKKPESRLSPMGGLDPYIIAYSGFLSGTFGPEERFRVIRVLDSLVNGREWVWRLDVSQLERLFEVMMKFFYPEIQFGRFDEKELKEDMRRFKKTFPRKMHEVAKEILSQIARSWGQVNFSTWIEGVKLSGNRMGLLLTGDFEAAFRVVMEDENLQKSLGRENAAGLNRLGVVARSVALRDLLVFASSEEYFRLRLRVGRAVPPGKIQI